MLRPPPISTLFPYTTLFRSARRHLPLLGALAHQARVAARAERERERIEQRSEEHTSELQSHVNLVCRLLLEKKKIRNTIKELPTSITIISYTLLSVHVQHLQ